MDSTVYTRLDTGPADTAGPASPVAPATPATPVAPTTPATPSAPATPTPPVAPDTSLTTLPEATPRVPATPATPSAPATPRVPATPATPVAPTTPATPSAPTPPVAPDTSLTTLPVGSLRDRVYAQLRATVLDGGFGTRERLSDVRLAARFGVSRTPVREALARLLADGLIERGEDGFHVAVLGLAQLRDLYELRITLELRGIARAIEDPGVRHDPGVIDAELERWYVMRERPPAPDPRFVVQDERFHAELSRASGNPALTDALVAVGERIRRVRMYDFLTEDRVRTTVTEHIEIMELVRTGRLDEAHRALHAHVGASMDVVLERARHAMTQRALHADDHL